VSISVCNSSADALLASMVAAIVSAVRRVSMVLTFGVRICKVRCKTHCKALLVLDNT
jgi:hypothetical protein